MEFLAHLDLSAASGLVHHGGFLYVVADDGLEVLRTDLLGANALRLQLSDAARVTHIAKNVKPDFEALLIHGSELVAIGSGSTAARCGAITFDPTTRTRRQVDFRPLYDALSRRIQELNIEGAVFTSTEVLLGQRGNGAKKENALVRLDRAVFEQELARGEMTEACFRELIPLELGDFEGVSLSLTDLAVGPTGELIFTAAAEATENPYDDGVVAGSVVGVLDARGHCERRASIPRVKLEGVCAVDSAELRLVADPDDPSARAPLFRLPW